MCCSAKSCIQFPLELSKAFLPAVSKLVPQKTDYSDAGKEELALLQLLSCEHSARSDPHPSLLGFDPTSSSLPQQVPGGCQSPPCVLLTSPYKKDGKNRNPGTYLLNKPPRCKHAAILMFFPISHLRDTPPAVVVCRGLGLGVCVCVCPRQPVFFSAFSNNSVWIKFSASPDQYCLKQQPESRKAIPGNNIRALRRKTKVNRQQYESTSGFIIARVLNRDWLFAKLPFFQALQRLCH